jgi:hypothetical protein
MAARCGAILQASSRTQSSPACFLMTQAHLYFFHLKVGSTITKIVSCISNRLQLSTSTPLLTGQPLLLNSSLYTTIKTNLKQNKQPITTHDLILYFLITIFSFHHHHHQLINAAGAQAFLMDYTIV